MILSTDGTTTRQSARLNLSFNYEILPVTDASDEFFKSLLIEDFNNSDDQYMKRFKAYLEKIIQIIILKRPLDDFLKILEDTLQQHIFNLKTNLYPKTSSRRKGNTEIIERTKVIKNKSRKANDSIGYMGGKILDFLTDLTHSKIQENEDFIILSHSFPDFCSEILSFFLCASNKKLFFSEEMIVLQKVNLQLLNERNGFSSIKKEALNLLIQLSGMKLPKQVSESYIADFWKTKLKISKPMSSCQLRKVQEWLKFLIEHLPSKRKRTQVLSARKKRKSVIDDKYQDESDKQYEDNSQRQGSFSEEQDDESDTQRSMRKDDKYNKLDDYEDQQYEDNSQRQGSFSEEQDDESDTQRSMRKDDKYNKLDDYEDEQFERIRNKDIDLQPEDNSNIDNTLHDMNRLIYDIETSNLKEDQIIAIGAYVFDALEAKLKELNSSVQLNEAIEKKIEKNREDSLKREEYFQLQLRSDELKVEHEQHEPDDEDCLEDNLQDSSMQIIEDKNYNYSSFESIISVVKMKVADIVNNDTEASFTTQKYPPQNMRCNIFLPVQFSDQFRTVVSYESLRCIFPDIDSFTWSEQSVVHVVIHYPQEEYWSYGSIVFKKRKIFFHEAQTNISDKFALSELKRFTEIIRIQYFKEYDLEFEVIVCTGPLSTDMYIVTVLQFLRGVLESLAWYPFSVLKYTDSWKTGKDVYFNISKSCLQAIKGILQRAITTGETDIFDVFYVLNSSSLSKQQLSRRSEFIRIYNLENCPDLKEILPCNVFSAVSNTLT